MCSQQVQGWEFSGILTALKLYEIVNNGREGVNTWGDL